MEWSYSRPMAGCASPSRPRVPRRIRGAGGFRDVKFRLLAPSLPLRMVLARFAEDVEWGFPSETMSSSRWLALRLSFPLFLNEEYSDGVKVGETLIRQSMFQNG